MKNSLKVYSSFLDFCMNSVPLTFVSRTVQSLFMSQNPLTLGNLKILLANQQASSPAD